MLHIGCFLLSILYISTAFLYSANAFLYKIKKFSALKFFFILNITIVAIILYFDIIIPDFISMILYFALVYIELKFIYNDKTLKNIFGTLCFAINFFAVRLIYISIYSLIYNISFSLIMQDEKILTIATMLTLLTSIVKISMLLIFSPMNFMDMITTDKGSIKFSLGILGSIYGFLIINSYFLYIIDTVSLVNLSIIKIAICALIGFFAALLYSYLFAKLQLYVVKVENIEKELQQDELAIKELENEANYDYFTSCLKRDVIYQIIDRILENNPFFCIVFIDIDGLKITNDVYGHDEGDFYIKAVSEILNAEFVGKAIGRIGGDEFLIVLEHTDIYATMKCVLRCYEQVNNLSKLFNKPYQTSISYGVVEVTPDNKLSRDELIKLADTYMYNFKKSRKKNRK